MACETSPPQAPFRELDSTSAAPLRASLSEHARRGAAIRDAVERGDVPAATDAAHGLVELVTTNERPSPETTLGQMVAAARRVAAAHDRREAAQTFAVLAERCGACHAAIGGPPSFHTAPPAEQPDAAPSMHRHQWGAARLWEGLVAPSDDAWKSGAAVLADAPFAPSDVAGPETEVFAATVHDLGTKAGAATASAKRVEIYGALLETCASCHQQRAWGRSSTSSTVIGTTNATRGAWNARSSSSAAGSRGSLRDPTHSPAATTSRS